MKAIPWEEVVAQLGPRHYMVDDLQAFDPDGLIPADGVLVSWGDELDSMGLPRVEVRAETREEIIDFVRDNWGDDDGEWFQRQVVDRIFECGAGAAPARRTHLVVRYDVTDLTREEIDHLSGELHAMAEACDGHQSVEVVAVDELKGVEA